MAEQQVNQVSQEVTDLTHSARDAYQTMVGSAVAAQERNVQFALNIFEQGIEQLKGQAETARDTLQAVTQQSQLQQDMYRRMAHQVVEAWCDVFFAPLSFYQKEMRDGDQSRRSQRHR
jgi:hypothetical protein